MRVTAAATPAAAITETGDVADALTWYRGALGEIHAVLDTPCSSLNPVSPRPLPAPHVMEEGTQGVVRGARHCATLAGAECSGWICRPPVDDSMGS
jgi:hypothetical protein